MKKRLAKAEQSSGFKILGLDISQISLVLVNLIPISGLFLFNWKIFDILVLYWLESVIILLFSFIKIIFYLYKNKTVGEDKEEIHFIFLSFLTYIPLSLIMLLFITYISLPADQFLKVDIKNQIQMLKLLIIPALFLLMSHFLSFITNYINKKEYKKITLNKLMRSPVKRIWIMMITSIIGAMVVINFNLPMLAIIILITLKTFFDLFAHNKEHNTTIFIKK